MCAKRTLDAVSGAYYASSLCILFICLVFFVFFVVLSVKAMMSTFFVKFCYQFFLEAWGLFKSCRTRQVQKMLQSAM